MQKRVDRITPILRIILASTLLLSILQGVAAIKAQPSEAAAADSDDGDRKEGVVLDVAYIYPAFKVC
jgi:hypothetical protein